MFKITSLIALLFSAITFASTNGGGVLSATSIPQGGNPSGAAFVKYQGRDRAEIVFQYGVPNKFNDVYTNQFKLRPEEIKSTEILKALKASMQSGEWKAIK